VPILATVEIDEHGRRLRGRAEKLAKRPQGVLANDVAVVGGQELLAEGLADRDMEVIMPELDHHFFELPSRVDGANEGVTRELCFDLIRRQLEQPRVEVHHVDGVTADRARTVVDRRRV
jgi:hypothetical protein